MEGEQHPKATSANAALVGLAMTLNEAIVEEAALGWFQELGYAVFPGPQLAADKTAAELGLFGDLALVGRLRVAIHQLKPVISLLAIPTLRDTLLTELLSRELSIAEVKNSR
jgi:hypothetical protein